MSGRAEQGLQHHRASPCHQLWAPGLWDRATDNAIIWGKKKIPQFKAIKRNLIMSLTQQCWEETNCFSERVSLGFSAFPSV